MVEGARLESVYTVKAVSRVQIPSSPPVHVSYFSRFPAVPLLLLHLDDSVRNGFTAAFAFAPCCSLCMVIYLPKTRYAAPPLHN